MLVIRTTNGVEVRLPLTEIESISEVEPATGAEREVAPHPYLHREGVNRCAACWRPRAHPAHADTHVRER
jgi:hypothetical protein